MCLVAASSGAQPNASLTKVEVMMDTATMSSLLGAQQHAHLVPCRRSSAVRSFRRALPAHRFHRSAAAHRHAGTMTDII